MTDWCAGITGVGIHVVSGGGGDDSSDGNGGCVGEGVISKSSSDGSTLNVLWA